MSFRLRDELTLPGPSARSSSTLKLACHLLPRPLSLSVTRRALDIVTGFIALYVCSSDRSRYSGSGVVEEVSAEALSRLLPNRTLSPIVYPGSAPRSAEPDSHEQLRTQNLRDYDRDVSLDCTSPNAFFRGGSPGQPLFHPCVCVRAHQTSSRSPGLALPSPTFALYEQSNPSPPQSSTVPALRYAGNDTHERHDTFTPSRTPSRQQQLNPPQPVLHTRPSTSSGGSAHTLRRTPRFGDDIDLLKRQRAVSQPAPRVERPARNRRRLTQDSAETSQALDLSTTTGAETPGLEESYWPKRTNRVSQRTATAILYALEEAIRTPFPFTPDRAEEDARLSMAGLQDNDAVPGGLPPAISDGNAPARQLTPPTKIMELRREREARRQAEQQAAAEEERRRQQEEERAKRRAEERRASEAAVGRNTQPESVSRQPLTQVTQHDERVNSQTARHSVGRDHQRSRSEAQQIPSIKQTTSRARAASTQQATAATSQPRQTESQKPKASSSFPHAFERWETLSSHWEGLTGYWIKRLQNNSDELHGQPLNQQLARQVTDLSAAGANLFHAVVELQRLRASSERKFQRWFFETRTDQEKQTEEIAKLKKALRDSRESREEPRNEAREQQPVLTREMQDRQDQQIRAIQERYETQLRQANDKLRAVQQAAEQQVANVRQESTKQLSEMRRELQISRDEARRGWEEIGRMEQGERDRMFSLKRGEPTSVGHIQVVPLMTRQAVSSRPTTREGGLSSHPVQPEDMQYANYGDARSETDTDPFTESSNRNTASTRIQQSLMPTSQPQTTYPTSAAAVDASTRATSASPHRVALSPGVVSSRSQPSASQSAYPPRSESYAASSRPGPTSAPGSAGFYQQQQPILHQQPGQNQPTVLHAEEVRSYGTASEADYDVEGQAPAQHAGYHQDRLRSPSEVSDDYGQPVPPGTGYAQATSNGNSHGVSAPDYSGAGYGGGRDEWGAVQSAIPRHHHPTRLSDIVEEASRTSPSRASERSHGFR